MQAEPFRILLVEDNDADVYLLRKALENAALNFELIVIDDGAEALAYARSEGKYSGAARPERAPPAVEAGRGAGQRPHERVRSDLVRGHGCGWTDRRSRPRANVAHTR